MLYTLTLVTATLTSTVPGLSAAECNFMVLHAPAVVAQYEREMGQPAVLIEAACAREDQS